MTTTGNATSIPFRIVKCFGICFILLVVLVGSSSAEEEPNTVVVANEERTSTTPTTRQLRRPNVVVVDGMKYVGQSRSSCRSLSGQQGVEGIHYLSKQSKDCFNLCNSNDKCYGFEVVNTPSLPQCQLWIQPIESMITHHQRGHSNRSCFRKVDDDRRGRILVQSAEDFLQDTRTSLLRSPSSTTKCPEPVENGRYCPLAYRPVSCGSNSCQYSNRCVAALAGYDKSFNGINPSGSDQDTECIPISNNIINSRTSDEETTMITASSASTTSNRADNDNNISNNNQTCPEPNPNGRCPQNYKPVVCGRVKQCQYSNRCFAALAGWNNPDREQCTEVIDPFLEQEQEQGRNEEQSTGVCPRSTNTQDGVCSLNYNPVTCSTQQNESCDYFNLCFAKLAGLQKSNCEETCPAPQTTTTTSRSIFSQATTWFHNTDTANVVTRTTHDDTSCGIHNTYNPVVCRNTSLQAKGTTCMYSNLCDAQSTNTYNIKQDCQMYCPSGNVGQMSNRQGTEEEAQALMKRNRLPPPHSASNSETVQECLRRNDGNQVSRPVTCGLNKCYYDNLCFATKGAGFDEDQCIFV